ncbi:MAG TPA: thiolase family protein [Jiangellaceae bacterium]
MYQRSAAIVGAGHSRLGEVPGSTSIGLMADAAVAAVEDAGLTRDDIDGIVVRGPDDEYCFQQQLGERLGLDAAFSTSLGNGGASQALAVILASLAIEAGLATTVLCGYARNSWSRTRRSGSRRARMNQATHQRTREWRDSFGYFGEAATHALGAQRHMALYGTTKEHLGHVAVSVREHASRNPHAQMSESLTMAQYLDGRLVAEPFGIYDCSLRTDGAGAVVVTDLARARDLRHAPVVVRGFGSQNNLRGWTVDDHMVATAARASGERAYRIADVSPADIDTAQLYDCFTYMVLAQLEDYGFCDKGDGGAFVASGALRLDGAIPTNTSGGQLSEGHVEGMLQIVEGVRQLRHEYSVERQVPDARLALVSGHGGNTVCHSTLILERP